MECLSPDETSMKIGKIFLPPIFDPIMGKLHSFIGYGDSDLVHEAVPIQGLMCTCRSVTFTDKATISDDQTAKPKLGVKQRYDPLKRGNPYGEATHQKSMSYSQLLASPAPSPLPRKIWRM